MSGSMLVLSEAGRFAAVTLSGLSTAIEYNYYRDAKRYLYDSTGRFFAIWSGFNWTF